MNEVMKSAQVKGLSVTDGELELINKQSLKTLTAEEVYTFKISACGNQIDRDIEMFSEGSLVKMSEMFVGKSVIMDHNWRAALQTARIYAGEVIPIKGVDGGKQLVLRAYMLRNKATENTIDAIDGGILREVSVGVRCEKAICSICGTDKRKKYCEHRRGAEYDGLKCHVILDEITDAYEVSFVAVPAQPGAGVTKTYGGEDNKPEGEDNKQAELDFKVRIREAKMKFLNLEMEENV